MNRFTNTVFCLDKRRKTDGQIRTHGMAGTKNIPAVTADNISDMTGKFRQQRSALLIKKPAAAVFVLFG